MAEIFKGVPRTQRGIVQNIMETPSTLVGLVPVVGSVASTLLFKPAEIERANARRDAAYHFAKILAVRGTALPREAPLHASDSLSLALRRPTPAENRNPARVRQAFDAHFARQSALSVHPYAALGIARRPHLDVAKMEHALARRRLA